ncbi:MAG: alkaline phosphatase D family protein [Ktedonobacteraceae bacterium]
MTAYLRIGPLVRATNATSAVIWAELSQPCTILLSAQSSHTTASIQPETTSVRTHTVTLGSRYYIAPQLHGLQPATWYTYWLSIIKQTDTDELTERIDEPLLFCFRTMDAVQISDTPEYVSSGLTAKPLRLVYGSCRKFVAPQIDALSAFGRWLREHVEQQETLWPHLLLLIGDQIYADQPPEEVRQQYPQLHDGATTFEDFALLYEYAWTQDSDVRQVLACLPTYMMFDDHEIKNNWNITPQWYSTMLQAGQEQVLVDGLIAYWVYQGWGNLVQREDTRYLLLRVMQEAEQSDVDILETLRTQIRREVCGERLGRWHYEIQTVPPLFVLNTRSERTSVFTQEQDAIYGPTRIISQTQMQELATWMQNHDTSPSLLISSVPVLLPPLVGLAEYMMGIRFWGRGLRWLGRRVAHIQQRLALRTSLEHWPIFSETWNEFVQIVTKGTHDVLVLSGDVHFSYAMEARRIFSKAVKTRLIQLVSTPLQNTLSDRNEQLVKKQARLSHLMYGGLDTRMLQLRTPDGKKRIQHDMLFQNALAYVTLTPDETHVYKVQQEYLGVVDGQLQTAGYTVMTER